MWHVAVASGLVWGAFYLSHDDNRQKVWQELLVESKKVRTLGEEKYKEVVKRISEKRQENKKS